MKRQWTVRVINYGKGRQNNSLYLPGIWIEQMRYMGFARELAHYDNPERDVIEFSCPKGIDSQVWADQNAARMRSFGIDAAACPKWGDEFGQAPPSPNGESIAPFMERNNRRQV